MKLKNNFFNEYISRYFFINSHFNNSNVNFLKQKEKSGLNIKKILL